MSETSGFHIQTAIIFAIFSLVFALIYFSSRRQSFSGWVAVAFTAAFIAYIIDSTRTSSTPVGFIFASTALFWIFCYTIAKALYFRCNAAFPTIPAALILVFSGLGFAILTFVAPDISMRSVLVNVTAAVLLALSLPPLWKERSHRIGGAIFGVVAAVSVTFVARVLIVYSLLQLTLTEQSYADSTYALIFHFTSAISGLALAVVLLLAAGQDMVLYHRNQSNMDPMTGLLNRRGLEGVFNDRPVRDKSVVYARSIIIFDLDHFKQINDRYGHAAGDKILQRAGGLASDLCEEYGEVARIGGEEFAILTKWMPVETAQILAQQICDLLGFTIHPELDSGHKVTASFGVAVLTDGESLADAMERADKALYCAKDNGRNQIALAKAA